MILKAECGCEVDDKVYCIMRDLPILFSIGKKTRIVKLIGVLFGENPFLRQSSRKIVRWERKLVIVPYNALKIHIYDLQSHEWSSIALPENKAKDERYIEAVVYKNRVVLVGAEEPNVVEIDMHTHKVKIINEYFKGFEKRMDLYCRSGTCLVGNVLFISLSIAREVLKINLDTYEYEVVVVPGEKGGFAGILSEEDYFLLVSRRGGDLIKWDGTNLMEKIKIPVEFPPKKCCFAGAFKACNIIVIQGFEWKYTLFLNSDFTYLGKKEISFAYMENNCINEVFGHLFDGTLWLYSEYGEEFCSVEVDIDEYCELLRKSLIVENRAEKGHLIKEMEYYRLEMYLHGLIN